MVFALAGLYGPSGVRAADPALEVFLQAQDPTLVDPAKAKPPASPFASRREHIARDDPRAEEYGRRLQEFLAREQERRHLTQIFLADTRRKAFALETPADEIAKFDYIARKIAEWNGDVFWAPANKETDENLRAVDEARAVFGPIPPFDVTRLGKFTRADGSTIETAELVVEVDGNQVRLKPNASKPGSPLEFEHRNAAGEVVKWTSTVDKCDKPSLAGGVTPCGNASRGGRIAVGNVEWSMLAR
jgi:hypothetical protein